MALSSDYTIRRSRRSSKLSGAAMIAVVAVLAATPYLVFQSVTSSMVMLFVLIVMASMWNLLAGFGGLVSIGQQAYVGVGAYTVVVFADMGMNPLVAVVGGGVTSALLALPTSWLAFRLRGDYFAVGTWVIAEVYRLVIIKFDAVGGADGKSLVGFEGMDPVTRSAFVYWFALGIAMVTVVGCFLLLRGRLGLALTAIRDDETAARSAGIDATRVKRVVYLISAVGCGLAGGILAIDALRVQPDAIFSVSWSAYMIFIVVIGGIGYLEGPIVGALVFFAMQQFLAGMGSWYLMLLGALAIIAAAWFPKGIWGAFSQRTGFRLFPVGYHVADAFPMGRSAAQR
mgnify:CR=1 FL=1